MGLTLAYLTDFLFVVIFYSVQYVLGLSLNSSAQWYDIEIKIIGGSAVDLKKYPYSAKFYNDDSMCGAVILNSWSVLTAAHCMDKNNDFDDMMVIVGARHTYDSGHEQVLNILTIVIHEKYNETAAYECDITILFLKSPIKFSNVVKKAVLTNNKIWMDERQKNFIVTGWGRTKPEGKISQVGLLMTHLKFIPKEKCEINTKFNMTPDMFCLYGNGERDTCEGDSGGGVLWNRMIVGITSHGNGCAERGQPGVYANVWYFRDWITQNVYNFIKQYCIRSMQLYL